MSILPEIPHALMLVVYARSKWFLIKWVYTCDCVHPQADVNILLLAHYDIVVFRFFRFDSSDVDIPGGLLVVRPGAGGFSWVLLLIGFRCPWRWRGCHQHVAIVRCYPRKLGNPGRGRPRDAISVFSRDNSTIYKRPRRLYFGTGWKSFWNSFCYCIDWPAQERIAHLTVW